MEQVKKALKRAKKAFEKIEHRTELINDGVSVGREIYEIDKALNELEQSSQPCQVNTIVSGTPPVGATKPTFTDMDLVIDLGPCHEDGVYMCATACYGMEDCPLEV